MAEGEPEEPVDRAAPLPSTRQLLVRYLLWLAFAVLVTWPAALHLTDSLIGHESVDVWNHAWGYWWVPLKLGSGELPWWCEHLAAPRGGPLYYIDMLGALLATPLVWVFGTTLTYNYVLMARVAMAGLAAQLLTAELLYKPGQPVSSAHKLGAVLGGAAYAASPYLLSELNNSISEVCNIHWVALTTVAAVRAFRGGGTRRWVLLGLLQALTTISTFYYGLLTALMMFLLYLRRLYQGLAKFELGTLIARGAVAAVVAVTLAAPFFLAFRASLDHDAAIIHRPRMLRSVLLIHNAVDPRDFWMPGDFQSVEIPGEYFLHTAYLRYSIVALLLLALWRRRDLWHWGGLAALSLVFALGDHLFWDGDFVKDGSGEAYLLPFGVLTQLIPQLAITHPLRFSVFAQLACSALAGVGLAGLLSVLGSVMAQRAATVAAVALVFVEGALGSSAAWPLPMADARVPDVYSKVTEGVVLDLPATAGQSMLTSKYLWYQTEHEQQLPYRVDVRVERTRDGQTFMNFIDARGEERPSYIDQATAQHIAQTYSVIIVHRDVEQLVNRGTYYNTFAPWFGQPQQDGDLLIWWLR